MVDIKPSEVQDIIDIGEMDGEKVKLIKTRGGLNIVSGSPRGKGLSILGAGSHQAIALSQAKKAYPSMSTHLMKSEHGEEPEVFDLTPHLHKNLYQQGFNLHSLKSNSEITYTVSKFNKQVGHVKAALQDNSLILQKSDKSLSALEGFAKTLLNITARDAIENKKDFIQLNNKKIAAKKVI